jgi:hypothetical protein
VGILSKKEEGEKQVTTPFLQLDGYRVTGEEVVVMQRRVATPRVVGIARQHRISCPRTSYSFGFQRILSARLTPVEGYRSGFRQARMPLVRVGLTGLLLVVEVMALVWVSLRLRTHWKEIWGSLEGEGQCGGKEGIDCGSLGRLERMKQGAYLRKGRMWLEVTSRGVGQTGTAI